MYYEQNFILLLPTINNQLNIFSIIHLFSILIIIAVSNYKIKLFVQILFRIFT